MSFGHPYWEYWDKHGVDLVDTTKMFGNVLRKLEMSKPGDGLLVDTFVFVFVNRVIKQYATLRQ